MKTGCMKLHKGNTYDQITSNQPQYATINAYSYKLDNLNNLKL